MPDRLELLETIAEKTSNFLRLQMSLPDASDKRRAFDTYFEARDELRTLLESLERLPR